jgi:hypothetical protein
MAAVDTIFQQVQDLVAKKLSSVLGKKFDLTTVAAVVKVSMESVDEISSGLKNVLSGARKEQIVSDLVKSLLNRAVDQNLLEAALRDKLVAALDTLGPVMFQLIVQASKGDFDLQHLEDDVKGACSCFGK